MQKPRISGRRGTPHWADRYVGTKVVNRVDPSKPERIAVIKQRAFLSMF